MKVIGFLLVFGMLGGGALLEVMSRSSWSEFAEAIGWATLIVSGLWLVTKLEEKGIL